MNNIESGNIPNERVDQFKDYLDTQGLRLTQGYRISYDTEKSIATVRTSRSSNASANTNDRPKDRVRIVIPPKEKETGKNQ